MKALERFAQLARIARDEPVPAIDVAAAVLRDLRSGAAPRRLDDIPLWMAAAISLLAASVMIAVALESCLPLVEPLAELFQPLTLVLL